MNILTILKKSWTYNIKTMVMGLRYKRDDRVWLFGAWMGERFADNSRFLYQYLSKHKNCYGISHVVWVTSNRDVYDALRVQGYEVVMKDSKDAIKWHLISGVHVICNNTDSFNGSADLLTEYSFGAKKIQLWHGVGIKACSGLTTGRKHDLREKLYDLVKKYGTPGMWSKCYFIATSKENARVAVADFHIEKRKVIIAGYPRLCECSELMRNEEDIRDMLKHHRNAGKKVILYLPTFRKNGSTGYLSPHDIAGVDDYCYKEGIMWIEKKHSADQTGVNERKTSNILRLDPTFDINVLLDDVDLIITDYSSVSSDAIYKDIPTIEYCPDYSQYKDEDRGFVNKFELYHDAEPILEPEKFLNTLIERINGDGIDQVRHERTKDFLFQDKNVTYRDIIDTIVNRMNIKVGSLR